MGVGVLYMLFIGRKLLPVRETVKAEPIMETHEEVVDRYGLTSNIFRLRVRLGSKLIGKSIAEGDFGARYHITVLEILRREEPRPALRLVGSRSGEDQEIRRRSIAPDADTIIEADDILIVRGDVHDVGRCAASWELGVQATTGTEDAKESVARIDDEVGVAEVLVPNRSRLIGKTVIETRFSQTYNLNVLGIVTPGKKDEVNIRDHRLRFGDTLLVQGRWEDIIAMRDERRDFVVLGQPEMMLRNPNRQKAMVALAVLAGMIVLMITNWLPLTAIALSAALVMV
ncbi:MAG: hypothetical protein M5U34_29865 [Chloroflexi bacterium]|nr:hypothetical protein [Chloroflexota bacterium]